MLSLIPQPTAHARRSLSASLAALALSSSYAHANPGDEICFPLYRDAGAIPGTSDCPLTASLANVNLSTYYCTADADRINRYCGTLPKNAGPRCEMVANPIHTGTGNKVQVERDYEGVGAFPLVFERYYNSAPYAAPGKSIGKVWRASFDRSVVSANSSTMAAWRHDGKIFYFTLSNGNWITSKDASVQLTQLKDASGATAGWELKTEDDATETYNAGGRLVSIRARNGQVQTYTRSDASTPISIAPGANYVIRITDNFGSNLALIWTSAGYIASVTDPAGQVLHYAYDSTGRLTTVTYSDGAKRTFLYNEAAYTGNNNLPYALTGILDENNARYATYTYDQSSRAVASEHADSADRHTLTFGTGQTTVTDPLGTARNYQFTTVLGSLRYSSVSQPAGSGCGPASNAITYDANGNVASRTDFNGNKTIHSYDLTRNLETQRVEASGTAQARTISTQWHPSYRLPAKIAESNKLSTFTYDTAGNLTNKTEQATSDASGTQGFGAATVGSARTWTWTYNSASQVLTAKGPRADVDDTINYAYDDHSNLALIADAAGHITTFSNYDANGRPGQITDPNGTTTTLTYNTRGWLISRSTAGEITAYDYDGVGQLKKVTLPDGSTIGYTYDDAHRLTDVADSLGSSIHYTLDVMGNRIKEEVKDLGGTLTRRTTRVYDALNRLQQITGGLQ